MALNQETKRQIDEFIKRMQETKATVHTNLGKAVLQACSNVENTAKLGMTNTQTDPNKGYKIGGRLRKGDRRLVGYKVHYASKEGQYPAVDTGALRRSVTHDVHERALLSGVVGRVGTVLLYGKMLEHGTSRMAPRPWLYPSVEKNRAKTIEMIREAVKGRQINISTETIE